MLASLKFFLANVRMLAADATFFTTQIAGRLQRMDTLVQNLAVGNEGDLRTIEQELQASAPAVTQMTDEAYGELYSRAVDAAEMQRAALKSVNHMQWLFLVSGLAVILLLAYQLCRSEKLYAELQSRESEIRSLAAIDPLTGLNNRRHFDERMKAIDKGLWTGDLHMLVVDLNGFKQVNDRHGHEAGDHLLRVIACKLPATAGHDALIARLGGDEFALVVRGDAESAKRTADAVIREVTTPVVHDGATLRVGASIGISSLRPINYASSTLLREADAALYQAKARGKGQAVHFLAEAQQVQSAA